LFLDHWGLGCAHCGLLGQTATLLA
jgi:hypothetical protein